MPDKFEQNSRVQWRVQDQLTVVQVRIHICAYDEIILGSFRIKVHYVLNEILDVTYFIRDTADDFVEQPYFLTMFLAYIGDVNYRRNHLRQMKYKIECRTCERDRYRK